MVRFEVSAIGDFSVPAMADSTVVAEIFLSAMVPHRCLRLGIATLAEVSSVKVAEEIEAQLPKPTSVVETPMAENEAPRALPWVVWTLMAIGVLGLFSAIMPFGLSGLFGLAQWLVWFGGFVAWLYAIYKAYQGEMYKIPVIGDLAERQAEARI